MSDVKKKKTHNFTKPVNAAIKKHGTPFLLALLKGGEIVDDFRYVQGEGFIKAASVLVSGRNRPVPGYVKGTVWIRDDVKTLIESLPEDLSSELNAECGKRLMAELEEGVEQRQVILSVFNERLQEDINKAMVASGAEPFAFEQEYVNGGGYDARVFVKMHYDGHFISEERLSEISDANNARKFTRMSKAAAGADARTGSANFAS